MICTRADALVGRLVDRPAVVAEQVLIAEQGERRAVLLRALVAALATGRQDLGDVARQLGLGIGLDVAALAGVRNRPGPHPIDVSIVVRARGERNQSDVDQVKRSHKQAEEGLSLAWSQWVVGSMDAAVA